MKKFIVGVLLAIVAALGGYGVSQNMSFGSVGTLDVITVFDDISATTTSRSINVEGAERVTLFFTVADVYGSGYATSTFAVTVSADDTNYEDYNKLIDNVTNTNAQDVTRVSSVTMATNDTKFYSMDLDYDNIRFIKVTDTITGTTTASVTVKALVDY